MSDLEFMPLERFYALKATFERVWGQDTYLDLKHCTDLRVWRRYCERTLRLTQIAATDSVLVADDEWHGALSEIIDHGISRLQHAATFDELFQSISATYIEISFHQFGFMPNTSPARRSKMKKGNWKLDAFRTVQYVQNQEQRANANRRRQQLVDARLALQEARCGSVGADNLQNTSKKAG